MGFIVTTILALIIGAGGLLATVAGLFDKKLVTRSMTGQLQETVIPNRILPTIGFMAGALTLSVSSFLISAYEQVEAGHVGVVRTFGEITGVLQPGANWIAPWQTVQQQNVQTQRGLFRNATQGEEIPSGSYVFGTIAAGSLETQQVDIFASVNYHLDPTKVPHLFRAVGPSWQQTLFPDKVQEHIKSVVVRYPAIEVTQKRDEIGKLAEASLTAELEPYGIIIEAIQLVNIGYSPEFERAIEAKQVATQDALRAQELVATKEAEARQKVAQARGEAKRTLDLEAFKQQMQDRGVVWQDRDAKSLLDEAPSAYKPIDVVMRDSVTLVEPVFELRQFVNFKGVD